MYTVLLYAHSWLRWLALGALLWALVQSITGVTQKRARSPADRKAALFAMIFSDVQLILGLILYFGLSPITSAAFADMKAAMKDPQLRYFAVEHITIMVLALAFVHIGYSRMKRAATDAAAFKGGATFFGLATLSVVVGIPWLLRPLLRF